MHLPGHPERIAALVLVLILAGSAALHFTLPRYDVQSTDVYYTYLEGGRLTAGENPYSRVLLGNMRENQKYATYFPLFYWLSALSQRLGLTGFLEWMGFWRLAFLAFNLGAGAILYYLLYRKGAALAAVFGALFWFGNRWNLQSTQVGNLDYVPIFFLLLALALLQRRHNWGLLALSVSLAFKQIAILLVPLFLVFAWRSSAGLPGSPRRRSLAAAGGLIASVPLVTAIPFLLWDARGFVYSIVFSMTRDAASHFDAPSLDTLLGLNGAPGRLIMFGLIVLVALVYWRREIGLYTACLLSMAAFVNFSAVLFTQYFCWLVPFAALTVADGITGIRAATEPVVAGLHASREPAVRDGLRQAPAPPPSGQQLGEAGGRSSGDLLV